MPELPEVETVVRILRPLLINQTIDQIISYYDGMFTPSKNLVVQSLKNQKILDITRIGKHIVFHFTGDHVILSHLRMEGKYMFQSSKEPLTRYARAHILFKDGHALIYDDMRKFGTWILSSESTYRQHPSIKKLGIEPMDVKDFDLLHQKFLKTNKPIKTALLDQTILLGLGNIYADEVLFDIKIHPLTPSRLLSKETISALVQSSQRILNAAIQQGGSMIRSYRPGKDIDGAFQLSIKVYGRDNQPCTRCHRRLHKIIVGGRGTTYCPRCQWQTNLPKVIAITGQIATGKSTFLNIAATYGYPTISSDAIVRKLYEKKSLYPKLIKIFGPEVVVDKKVNKGFILSECNRDRKRLKNLELLLHPLVKKEIIFQISRTKSSYIFMEVPLLFQANMDYLAYHIILVTMPREKQITQLKQRNPSLVDDLLLLDEQNKTMLFKDFVDEVVVNDKDLSTFEKLCHSVIKNLAQS
jgi:formamidopyrimidine-DNA glycosylase